jgi:hypothetical protein
MFEPNKILLKMQDRLLAALVNGPSLNCRPYASRQRLDLVQLGKLGDISPEDVLRALLGPSREATIKARIAPPKTKDNGNGKPQKLKVATSIEAADEHGAPVAEAVVDAPPDAETAAKERTPEQAWNEQDVVLRKLHTIEHDADGYEKDTGVTVLNIGFPLLSLPPGALGGGNSSATRRVLAPLAFIPVSIGGSRGIAPSIELACNKEGSERVRVNDALIAWLEQQTGNAPAEADIDEEGGHPWREICEIVHNVGKVLDIPVPEMFQAPPPTDAPPALPPPTSQEPVESGGAADPSPYAPQPSDNANKQTSDNTTAPSVLAAHLTVKSQAELSRHVVSADDFRRKSTSPAGSTANAPQPVPVSAIESGSPASKAAPPADEEEADADPQSQRKPHAASRAVEEPPPALINLQLQPASHSDEDDERPRILCSAVLGLFPMANQGLLHDMQTMIKTPELTGPVESFIRIGVSFDAPPVPAQPPPSAAETQQPARPVVIAEERFISGTDPCQARAVRLARECQGLVVHGPPGTGKSQTITNIIGDHLARGQRVLVVCDKRTALDVVFNRLQHMGLAGLCAVVHDPRRDHRELYKSIQAQLEDLETAKPDAKAEQKLAKADAELKGIHEELTRYRDALTRRPGEHGMNFHELVGEWLSLAQFPAAPVAVEAVGLATMETYSTAIGEVLGRGDAVAYGVNPWVAAAGMALGDFLAQPMDRIRAATSGCEEAARAADATINPIIPPFAPSVPLGQQAEARTALAGALPGIIASADKFVLARWAAEPAEGLGRAKSRLEEVEAFVKTFRAGPLDAELLENVRVEQLDPPTVASHLLKLAGYQDIATKWYAFLPLRAKSEAAKVINGFGLTLSADNAARVQRFLNALRARTKLSGLVRELRGPDRSSAFEPTTRETGTGALPDDALEQALKSHVVAIELMQKVRADVGLTGLADRIAAALMKLDGAGELIEGLRQSAPRAAALENLETGAAGSRLFDAKWLSDVSGASRAGQVCVTAFTPLRERVETLEGVLRIRQGLGLLPLKVRSAVEALMKASVEADCAAAILRREALAGEISARLAADPNLQNVDGHRLETAFNRYRELDEQKRRHTRDALLHRWISRQQERLLAPATRGKQSPKAALRSRLKPRLFRLRQMIARGAGIEGGDTLFDICPVWLCSPETVAQAFPLKAVFDVIVFDEASQMRLEESLPVLVRGKRVVIAGDPQQLPPTRFFESALVISEDDEAESDQDFFEQQQGEIEDLLSAALGLDIRQCYLDVHYRSRHAGLIAFSNEYFYASRLQPIPGHPSANGDAHPPVEMEHVGGTYDKRRNEAEAARIVEIVKELLSRKDAPSIGIACFNLVQRDLILEKLDETAAEDAAFAKRLQKSRDRVGEGSAEGLFVKNLENVQGDERDYILISTTYGPDPAGKFYRRFGPLGRPGGGRRLNVLVTRAREKVHIVTSIPAEAYRTLPDLDTGQAPGGTWLLLAYLKFAEQLQQSGNLPLAASHPAAGAAAAKSGQTVLVAEMGTGGDQDKETGRQGDKETRRPKDEEGTANSNLAPKLAPNVSPISAPTPAASTREHQPRINILPAKSPSAFAQALAQRLAADHGVGSDVHWGNEGFCVDLALRDPADAQKITIGVLCDAARFAAADDPMQWDIFRTGILESQGWKLHRLWTPHFFRDPAGVTRAVVAEADQSRKA